MKLNIASVKVEELKKNYTDSIFILTQIVLDANKKNKPVFSCFVDLAKVFDNVNLELLWSKLISIGLSSTKML